MDKKTEKCEAIGIWFSKLLIYYCLGAAAFLMGLGLGYTIYRCETTLETNMDSVAVDSTVVYKVE